MSIVDNFLKLQKDWTKNIKLKNIYRLGFPGGAAVESLPANAGDMGSGPGPGGSHMPRSS